MSATRTGTRSMLTAGLLLLTGFAAHAQQWWNPDYSKRIPLTINSDLDVDTPTPTTAEVTLSPIPAEIRADWNDIRVVYTNGSIVKDLERQVLLDEAPVGAPGEDGRLRVVFRLQEPIPAFGSTTNYTLYYGALSPDRATGDPYNIYDYVVDFLGEENVVGHWPPAWEAVASEDNLSEPSYNIEVREYKGVKQGFFEGNFHHPQAFVKEGFMPEFLNAEFYARITPQNQGTGEINLLGRVPASPINNYPNPDRAYGGGYGFVMGGWGDQNGIVHWTGIDMTKSPPKVDVTLMASDGKDYFPQVGVAENVVFRATDTLAGKTWKDGVPQRPWDREYVGLDERGVDPVYDKPGTVGVASYYQNFYVQYIAAREIRTSTINGITQDAPTGQIRIAGTVRSTTEGPLADTLVTISDGSQTWNVYTAADGRYQVSLPAGSYTVSATRVAHIPVSLTNITPTVAGITDITLTYEGVVVSGIVRERLSNRELANAKIIVTDSAGMYLTSGTTDSQGRYTVELPRGGTYTVGALTDDFSGRVAFTVASGAATTQNIVAAIVPNGDAELPNETNTWAAGWSKDLWNAHGSDGVAFELTNEQNHTPGGHWSVVVRNPHPTNNSGINDVWTGPAVRQFPIPPSDVTLTTWVYADTAGLTARVRTRSPGWDDGGGATYKAGTDFPVGQWFKIETTDRYDVLTDGQRINYLEFGIYAGTSIGDDSQPVKGNIYFDDVSVSVTPRYVVIAKVVDKNGTSLTDAYAGFFTDGGVNGAPKNFMQNFTRPNLLGEVRVFTGDTNPVDIGAVAHMNGRPDNLPEWGYLVDRKAATPVAWNPNSTSPTITLNATQKAANIPDPETQEIDVYTWHMVGGVPTRVERNGQPITNAFDNKFTTWSGNGGNQQLGSDPLDPSKKPRWNVIDINLWDNVAIDQFEFSYETATPRAYKIWVTDTPLDISTWPMVNPPDADLVVNAVNVNEKSIKDYMNPYKAEFSFLGGDYTFVRLAQPKTGQYVRIWYDSYWDDGHTGFREIRILSSAVPVPPPFAAGDVQRALQIVGGLESATEQDMDKFDVTGDNVLDMNDVLGMARQVATW